MKHPSRYKGMIDEARTIRRTCGSMVGRDGPERFLRGYEGLLQSDGYAAYQQVGGPKIVPACCWAHYLDQEIIQSFCV